MKMPLHFDKRTFKSVPKVAFFYLSLVRDDAKDVLIQQRYVGFSPLEYSQRCRPRDK